MAPRVSLLLCNNARCASPADVTLLTRQARQWLAQHARAGEVMSVRCLELCGRGPHVVVHGANGSVAQEHCAPDGGVAYDQVDGAGLWRILDEHVAGGTPVTSLLHNPAHRR